MSATAESEFFASYFSNICTAPIYEIPGRTFPVKTYFLEHAVQQTAFIPDGEAAIQRSRWQDKGKVAISGKGGHSSNVLLSWNEDDVYGPESLDYDLSDDISIRTRKSLAKMDPYRINFDLIETLVKHIHKTQEKGGILVFLPGLAEIKRLVDVLDNTVGLFVIPLHSALDAKLQRLVFQSTKERKVVLSTNIAETGVTIPDIVYVIDTCRAREVTFDDRQHVKRLMEIFVSKANCKQRRGRAGRVREGVCYHLIPSPYFETLVRCISY
jgi:ATP-dependent RNA helicase DHX29